MQLTKDQKLQALEYRFYSEGAWYPKAGDLYTTARNDLEVYRVVDVRDGVVITEYTENGTFSSEWPLDTFLTEGFGPKRVWVPDWIIES